MKKSFLTVIGDSFMSLNHNQKVQATHWSEMMPDYAVENVAKAGSSLSIINIVLYQIVMTHPTDLIVIGFTDPFRLVYPSKGRITSSEWLTSNHRDLLNHYEKLADDTIRSTVCQDMQIMQGAIQMVGMLDFLARKKIKFAFTYGLFEKFLSELPNYILDELETYNKYRISYNLTTHPSSVATGEYDPTFHVADPEAQQLFAQQVNDVLTNQ